MLIDSWPFVSNVSGTLGALVIAAAALIVRRRQNEALYQAWISTGALLILNCFFLQVLPYKVEENGLLNVLRLVSTILFGAGAVFVILWFTFRQPKKHPLKSAKKPK